MASSFAVKTHWAKWHASLSGCSIFPFALGTTGQLLDVNIFSRNSVHILNIQSVVSAPVQLWPWCREKQLGSMSEIDTSMILVNSQHAQYKHVS